MASSHGVASAGSSARGDRETGLQRLIGQVREGLGHRLDLEITAEITAGDRGQFPQVGQPARPRSPRPVIGPEHRSLW